MHMDLAVWPRRVMLAALLALGACSGGGSDAVSSAPPIASFTASSNTGDGPLTVSFNAAASTASAGPIASYGWVFGDGETGSGRSVTHVFKRIGTFKVQLTVADSGGAAGSATTQVVVSRVAVPDLAGMTQSDAEAALEVAGVKVGRVTRVVNAAVPFGNVVAQLPSAGLVAASTEVTLVVSAAVVATIAMPAASSLVPDDVRVVVFTDSLYAIREVVAALDGAETDLPFTTVTGGLCGKFVPACPGYAGTLPLAGRAIGAHALRVRAQDVRGNVHELSIEIVHDNPPALSIVQPAEWSVALPALAVDASCTDDAAGCTVEAVGYSSQSPGRLLTTLDLASLIGQDILLHVRATDSAGQQTTARVHVVVAEPGRLAVVAEAAGLIVDADERRLLVLRDLQSSDELVIYDRASGAGEDIALPATLMVRESKARLTPSGAVFLGRVPGADADHAYLWRLGMLADLGKADVGTAIVVAGDFAVWSDEHELRRVSTQDATVQGVAVDSAGTPFTATADGATLYTNLQYQLVRSLGGSQALLTSNPAFMHLGPRSDGGSVVYGRVLPDGGALPMPRSAAVAVIENGSDTLVTGMRVRDSWPDTGLDYQTADDWIAFTDVDARDQLQVFARDPTGGVVQRTDFANDSSIERLGANGELMLVNLESRYFSDGTAVLRVGTAQGRTYQWGGAWFVTLGRALMAVDTRP